VAPDPSLDNVGALARRVSGNLRRAMDDGGWAVEAALHSHLGDHPELLGPLCHRPRRRVRHRLPLHLGVFPPAQIEQVRAAGARTTQSA
jgi:hypothetical protein